MILFDEGTELYMEVNVVLGFVPLVVSDDFKKFFVVDAWTPGNG